MPSADSSSLLGLQKVTAPYFHRAPVRLRLRIAAALVTHTRRRLHAWTALRQLLQLTICKPPPGGFAGPTGNHLGFKRFKGCRRSQHALSPCFNGRPEKPFARAGGVLATGGTKRCIAVSTLAEAEFYADHGFEDICYAVPITKDDLPGSFVDSFLRALKPTQELRGP